MSCDSPWSLEEVRTKPLVSVETRKWMEDGVAKVEHWFLEEEHKPGIEVDEENKPMCYYRAGENQTPCAIGVLIPDEQYEAAMENWTVDQLREVMGWPGENIEEWLNNTVVQFLLDLQKAHDRSAQEGFYRDEYSGKECCNMSEFRLGLMGRLAKLRDYWGLKDPQETSV